MEWYVARDAMHQPVLARAVVIVHESGRGMTVGRILAKGLNVQGLHTFLIHLPGYGNRRSKTLGGADLVISGMKQGIADVRRARDVVISLPLVDQYSGVGNESGAVCHGLGGRSGSRLRTRLYSAGRWQSGRGCPKREQRRGESQG